MELAGAVSFRRAVLGRVASSREAPSFLDQGAGKYKGWDSWEEAAGTGPEARIW